MRTIIVTVGTSLKPKAADETAAVRLIREDPVHASAESHTLHRLRLDRQDQLVFVHSDTSEGEQCAAWLCAAYRPEVHAADRERVLGLSYDAGSFARRGLRQFVNTVMSVARRAAQAHHEIVLCATGGFKAETALAAVCGQLLAAPTYYVHEAFDEIVLLPPLPVAWDLGWADQQEVQAFLHWIDEEYRPTQEALNRMKGLDSRVPMLVEDDKFDGEQCLVLSALGSAFYQACLARRGEPAADWPPASGALPSAKLAPVLRGDAHHRPKGWKECYESLSRCRYVLSIETVELQNAQQSRVSDVSEDGVVTLLYADGEKAEKLRLRTTARGQAQTKLVADHLFGHYVKGR